MNLRLLIIATGLLAGCVGRVPLHSFAPHTTADGVQGWQLSLVNYPKGAAPTPILEYEIGRRQMCPNGWAIRTATDYSSSTDRVIVYEGACKTPATK